MRIILPKAENNKFDLSIIIPCYNESSRIAKTFGRIDLFLKDRPYAEVVLVNDGSKDDTSNKIHEYVMGKSNIFFVDNKNNKGKWGAIRDGVAHANGKICILMDVDLSVGFEYVDEFMSIAILDSRNVVIGNRYGSGSKIPFRRYIFSRGFNFLMRVFTSMNLSDTQLPFKAFTRDAVSDEFIDLTEERFAGDVDFLMLCSYNNKKIIEVPVIYIFEEGSQLNVRKHGWEMFKSLFRMRYKFKGKKNE